MATKKTTTKAVEVKEVKVEAPVVEKAPAKKAPAKKAVAEKKEVAEKKAPAKKAAATEKKAPAKKAAAKKSETVITLEFGDYTAIMATVEEKVKAQYVAEGHKASSIKSLNIYVKPFENSAYYVVNEEVKGRVDLF